MNHHIASGYAKCSNKDGSYNLGQYTNAYLLRRIKILGACEVLTAIFTENIIQIVHQQEWHKVLAFLRRFYVQSHYVVSSDRANRPKNHTCWPMGCCMRNLKSQKGSPVFSRIEMSWQLWTAKMRKFLEICLGTSQL